MRLGIVASHPVQYQAPWYRALAAREELDLTVYFALLPTPEQQGVGFGTDFAWDVPLLDGYRWVALRNGARSPALRGFFASPHSGSEPCSRAPCRRGNRERMAIAHALLPAFGACAASSPLHSPR